MLAKSCGRAARAARFRAVGRIAMPLRAKILNPAFGGRVQMRAASDDQSSRRGTDGNTPQAPIVKESAEVIMENPQDPKGDVLFDNLFGVRTIELNRPEKLHSLNGSMIRKIVPRLREWQKSDMANVIIIKGAGPRAFCAGGDVVQLAHWNKNPKDRRPHRSADYFALEYKLDHLIATYQKPYIAYMDGITMGGGVGLSIHAPIRIATENTVFAMPETTIGFFPDVGASFFLPRMPGAVGTYLALTSEKLKGVNVYYTGVATHYTHSTSLPGLQKRLAELRFKDYETLKQRLVLINSTIEEYCTGIPHDQPMLIQGELRKAIDRCFGNTSVPAIIAALKAETGEMAEWAQKTLTILHKRSPTSVYVTLRQMQLGKKWSIAETFQREHSIAAKFMQHPDFNEGVEALLVRKDGNPNWSPASLEDIRPEDNVADPFFRFEGSERLQLLNNADYKAYPHAWLSIPTEAQVAKVVKGMPMAREDVVRHFVRERYGKQGIKEIVQEIVSRMTTLDKYGLAEWNGETTTEAVEEPTAVLEPKSSDEPPFASEPDAAPETTVAPDTLEAPEPKSVPENIPEAGVAGSPSKSNE